MVPYNAMPAEMTSEFKDRSKLITIRMLFSQTGMLLGAVLPLTIINFFKDTPSTGYMIMAMIFGLVFSIPWIFVFKGTYESERKIEDKKDLTLKAIAKKVGKDFGSTVKNKSLRIHTVMYITAYVSMDVFNALLIYFMRDYIFYNVNMGMNYQLLLGTVVIIQMLSLFIVMKFVNKFGNARTYRIHASAWILALLGLLTVKMGAPIWLVLIIGIIVGFGLSGCVMTPYNMLAFVVDADEIITTKRREGIYAGMMTFLRKIAQALALFLVGLGLEYVGYKEPVQEGVYLLQSADTLNGIRLMLIITPIVLLLLGIYSSFRFKINPHNHEVLMTEINRLHSGGSKEDVTEKTKEVVESITGLDYQDLWQTEALKND
jgi:oligogalacturonide transporter